MIYFLKARYLRISNVTTVPIPMDPTTTDQRTTDPTTTDPTMIFI